MRVTYRDTSVDGRPSLQDYVPADAKYASIPDGEGWLTLVEADEYWHSALVEVGFVVEPNAPEVLTGVEFITGRVKPSVSN